MLAVENLTLKFGGLLAVSDVSFDVREGEIFSIIGPNGAGKTSLFNAISGVYEPTDGKVLLNGDFTHKPWRTINYFYALFYGVLLALLLFLAVNVNSLWQSLVIDTQPITIGAVINGLVAFGSSLEFYEGGLPLLIGFLLGSFGWYTLWKDLQRSPDFVARCGMARTFQNIRLFSTLTALENVMVAMDLKRSAGILGALFRTRRFKAGELEKRSRAQALLEFVGLKDVEKYYPANLSYGSQRKLEIARALALQPKILLLDEPAAGMNPNEAKGLMDLILQIRASGITVLLIEHHIKVVMGISDRILVLHNGNVLALGTPEKVRNDQTVIEAYLGKGH